MAESTPSYIKQNWLTLANLIILISLSFRVGYTTSLMESNINSNTEHIEVNTDDIYKHNINSSYEKNSKLFVPRVELDGRLLNIEKLLERIESNLPQK